MKKLHYSKEMKRRITGGEKRVRRPVSEDLKQDLQIFIIMGAAVAAFIASIACYIGIL